MKDPIREAVKQWLAKAGSDWSTVEILMASEHCPTEAVCFHCQQYVEKILKALLTLKGIEAPKTHDLPGLFSWHCRSSQNLRSWWKHRMP